MGENEQMKEKSPAAPWASLFAGNRVASNSMSLDYITPAVVDGNLVVQLEKDEQAQEEENGKVASPVLYYHEDGYYIAKFQSVADMQEIVYSGPYCLNNKPLILKQWTLQFDLSKEFLSEIPLWIKLPKLPMNCWSCDSLSHIGNAIGCPMFADECTTKQTRISYARMIIEVDVTKPLPDEIAIIDANVVIFHQRIEYEWKPEFCEKCQKVGHDCGKVIRTQQLNVPPKKKKKFTQVWQAHPTKPAVTAEKVPPRDQPAPQQLRVSTTVGKDTGMATLLQMGI
ncbi:uncharacterized protein LOC132061616 [Lycium ferocissimum]|uniref:uncharacterized protein LOC132061616 n=1 Tax=Lycium ferocissimum TaxID=112874 RepID=UPI0028156D04|nr:uncharacterized protein LOC132061616 [Lycium ferocissimum]